MKRAFLLPAAAFAAVTTFAGCNAGSSFSNPSPINSAPVATATPAGATPTPTALATATPIATPTPVSGTTAIPGDSAPIYHPADNGDTFAMAGNLTIAYQRPNATPDPEPTQMTLDTVAQTTTVTNPGGTFAANPNAIDFHTVETDSQTAPVPETFGTTTDDYFVFSDTLYTGNFTNLGYVSTNDSGDTVTLTYGAGNGLTDVLPETAGATWTNGAAATIATVDTNNESSMQTYAADGSYAETVQYPNVNAMGPTTTQTLKSNLDGSGTLSSPLIGTALSGNYTVAISPPSAAGSSGTIGITTTQPAAVGSTAAPTVTTTAIPNWIPTGVLGTALATESDIDNGATNLPAACAVPAPLAASANEIVQTKSAVDPLLGTLETSTTTTYDIANVGPACVTIADVQTVYYDFSGQSGFSFFSGIPQQITNLNETLYLTAEQLSAVARKPALRAQASRSLALRVTLAQARISSARVRQRSQRLHDLVYRTRDRGFRSSRNREIL